MIKQSVFASGLLVVSLIAGNVGMAQQKSAVSVPAFRAYSEPDPEALHIEHPNPITDWSDEHTQVVWYGLIRTEGKLDVAVKVHVPAGQESKLRLKVGDHELKAKTVHGTDGTSEVNFGSVDVKKIGGYRFALSGLKKTGANFGEIDSLELSGPAAENTLFDVSDLRGAPSVHLNYPIPEGVKAKWFYNEVTVKTDPVWSYYMACGFARGYFGIQVNSPTERRIIFSVWDSGNEPTDRGKVSAENRVQLLAKGENVVASDFGNEGTGGHSHLVYPWKTGNTYRFLVSAEPEGETTVYTGYFYFPEKQVWSLIAKFRAPKDGKYLSHLYSFNEDFEGANGQQKRFAEFGNQWIKTTDDKWIELTNAKFTHTARGKYKDRLDRGAGVTGDRFFLTNGGFKPETIEFGDPLTRPAGGKAPDVELPGQ